MSRAIQIASIVIILLDGGFMLNNVQAARIARRRAIMAQHQIEQQLAITPARHVIWLAVFSTPNQRVCLRWIYTDVQGMDVMHAIYDDRLRFVDANEYGNSCIFWVEDMTPEPEQR